MNCLEHWEACEDALPGFQRDDQELLTGCAGSGSIGVFRKRMPYGVSFIVRCAACGSEERLVDALALHPTDDTEPL